MKRPILITLTVICSLVAVWLIGMATHWLEFYTVSSTSNQPTYQPGSIIFASSLKKPGRNTMIIFKRANNSVWIFRCIAKEGDLVEIRQGAVYLNNILLNEPYAWNEYSIGKRDISKIQSLLEKNKVPARKLNDSVFAILSTSKQLKEYQLNLQINARPHFEPNAKIYKGFYNSGYNEDNIGPLKVPQGSFFVLGDSRHDAFDSRFFGFVKADDVISTVLN
jgi:signal peptidase I